MRPQTRLLQIGALLIVINILLIAAWWLFFNHITQKRDAIIAVRMELEKINRKTNSIKNLEQLLVRVSAQQQTVNEAFVDEKSLVLFIKELEQIAEMTGVTLKVTGASVPQNEERKGPDFIAEIYGNFDDIYRFMTLLNNAPSQVLFDTARVQKEKPENASKGPWQARFAVRVISYTF